MSRFHVLFLEPWKHVGVCQGLCPNVLVGQMVTVPVTCSWHEVANSVFPPRVKLRSLVGEKARHGEAPGCWAMGTRHRVTQFLQQGRVLPWQNLLPRAQKE